MRKWRQNKCVIYKDNGIRQILYSAGCMYFSTFYSKLLPLDCCSQILYSIVYLISAFKSHDATLPFFNQTVPITTEYVYNML